VGCSLPQVAICRAQVSDLVSTMEDLKSSFGDKLLELSSGLEDVVALKNRQEEFTRMQQAQDELQEELQILSRMLKQREGEISGLQAQLEQVTEVLVSDMCT
jgi:chromosome segregation ATPase